MKQLRPAAALLCLLLVIGLSSAAQMEPASPVYLDSSQPLEKRIDDLMSRMTLKEKVGQLNMPCVYVDQLGKDIATKMNACKRFAEGTYTGEIGPGGGFFTLANTILKEGVHQQVKYFNGLQNVALKKTRLKIPLLQTEEGTHGAMFPGATVFPEGLALGSTFDMDLLQSIYSAAAAEARSVGIHELCTLVVEPNRDPRLGRNAEGFSEDPYLCSRVAESIVRGAQGYSVATKDKVVTVLCHYPGQSQPVSGMERGAMEISERALREVFLPPWVAGIKKAGALGVMATYPEIDDVPNHGNEMTLTKILREELGFKGLVLSEGEGFSTLQYENIVATQKEAGAMSLKAGVDVNITYEPAYMKPLIENVQEGKVSMMILDRAVRRVLEQKFRLGLFDQPYADPNQAEKVVHSPEHQELALRAAREGIILLKNDGNLLPLSRNVKSVAVIGPDAAAPQNQLGDYSPSKILQHVTTVLEGIRAALPASVRVTYAKGCDVVGDDKSGFTEAVSNAKSADVAVVVLGEQQERSESATSPKDRPTDGEGFDVASLDLTGVQEDLIRAVYAAGKPVIVVLINARPLSIRWTAAHVPAILEAWEPGERGGQAVAEILFGDTNPSGRLAITVPRHSGQLPAYYNYKPSKEYWIAKGWGERYVDMPATPLYPFGYGLSYTKFEYSNLRIDPRQTHSEGHVNVLVDVKNVGKRPGTEVVEIYIHNVLGSVSTPVKQLRGFRRLNLKPNEAETAEFTLTHDDLALLNSDMHWVVEPGGIEIMAGSSSENIRLKTILQVLQ
ncbi:MAG: glycoside hydrolase family 3 C-terminal domain-containing protein [Bryobacteraceae bacterium]